MEVKLKSLSKSKEPISNLNEKKLSSKSQWTAYQSLLHCSKTIEYSMIGYPVLKPAIIRNTIGKMVIKKFLKEGYMKHNLYADVPGSPVMDNLGSCEEGIRILINSIEKFDSYNGEFKPHLLFGKLSKEQYDKYFTIHIEDHLSVF